MGVVIVVDDVGHPLAELRQVLHVLFDPILSHIIGSWLGPQEPVIADVLLGEAVPVVTTNDRIGKVEVLDYGLQFAFVFLGDLPAKDHGDLLGLTDGSIHVQQTFREFIHGGTSEEDQIVAVLYLREEQTVLTADLSSFLRGEEGSERRQPLLPALQ